MSKLNLLEEISLAEVIPIVKALPFPQRQALKQLLDKSDEVFSRYPEDEVESDLKRALERVRHAGKSLWSY